MRQKAPKALYYVKRKPFFRFFKQFLRFIKPKVTVCNENEGKVPAGIFLSNHSAASGPLMIELYLPYDHHPWGAYQMNGDIRSRFNYLYYTFFMQKKHMKKLPAFIMACIVCVVSKMFYKGMGLISSYPDIRLKNTMNESIAYIEKGTSVVIYPENSDNGYDEIIGEFHPGFIALSSLYYAKHGVDLPVYSMYFHLPTAKLVVGTPDYIQPMLRRGMNNEQIAAYFCKKTNALHDKYIGKLTESGMPVEQEVRQNA